MARLFLCGFESGSSMADFPPTRQRPLNRKTKRLLALVSSAIWETPTMHIVGPDLSRLTETQREHLFECFPHWRAHWSQVATAIRVYE